MESAPAIAKAGAKNPRQKLTPSFSQPVWMKVVQTSLDGALWLVARIPMPTTKNRNLRLISSWYLVLLPIPLYSHMKRAGEYLKPGQNTAKCQVSGSIEVLHGTHNLAKMLNKQETVLRPIIITVVCQFSGIYEGTLNMIRL